MTQSFFIAVFLLGAPASKEGTPKKGEPPVLVGKWTCTSFAFAGGLAPGQRMTFEFMDDGKLRTHQDGRVVREGKYKVEAGKEAAEIDFNLGARDHTLLGIYKVEGDVLMICYDDEKEGKRPAKYESPAGTNLIIITCKRAAVPEKKE